MINETGHRIVCSLETNASCWNTEVHRLNDEFSNMMSSVVVLMVALMVIGFTGNTIVLLVYGHRPTRTTAQIFIMYLASTDLLACIMIHPYVIYKLFNNYNQTWTAVCKVFEFTIHASLTISGVSLLAIATDRYLAICRPIKFLDFHKQIYKIIFATFAFGTLGSIPLLLFYGQSLEEIIIGNHIFVGYKCDYTENYKGSAMFGYSTFVVSCFLLEIVGIVVLYKNVAVVAFRSRRRVRPIAVEPRDGMPMTDIGTDIPKTSTFVTNLSTRFTEMSQLDSRSMKSFCVDDFSTKMSSLAKKASNVSIPGTSSTTELTLNNSVRTVTLAQESKLNFITTVNAVSSNELSRNLQLDSSVQPISTERKELAKPNRYITETDQAAQARQIVSHANATDKSGQIQRLDRTKKLSSGLKAAKILFLVTAVFVLSWLPFFSLRLMYAVGILSPVDRSPHRQVLEHFLNHCFYINNAANPLIYSMINQNFRLECWNRLKRLCGVNRNN